MTSIPKWIKTRGGGNGASSRIVLASAGGALLAGALSFAAWAEAPPAGTVIGNQASASYVDPNGTAQLATSNLVQTTVEQVGSFTLNDVNNGTATSTTVQNTKTGAAGATLYAPHVLTNTGNGTDKFDITVIPDAAAPFATVQIFADANGDGLPDGAALCTSTNPGAGDPCTVQDQSVAGNNGKFQFVVAYRLPATAVAPLDPYSFGTVSVQVDSADPDLLASYGTATVSSSRDNIKLTTTAAFNVSKAIGAPAVAAANGGAWNFLETGGIRSTSATCGTTMNTITVSDQCRYTTYTIRYDNSGGGTGRFAMQDELPSGFTYVTGSSVWSSAGGTPILEDGTVVGGLEYRVVGNVITAVDQALPANNTRTISMIVLVNTTAALGETTTTNTVEYQSENAAGATTTTPGAFDATSNTAAYDVLQSYGFAFGSTSSTTATALDTVAGTPNAGADDVTTVAQAAPGSAITFTKTVFNTGNGTDTFDLSVASSTFPAGTLFNFFGADGATPLVNSGGNPSVDTGPIAAGASATVVIRANLPGNAVVGSGPFGVNVLGKSAGAPTTQTPGDATRGVLTIVVGSLADLTNTAAGSGTGSEANGDLGPGPSPDATLTNTTAAGEGTVFPLFIKNNDTAVNTFEFSASQTPSFPGNLPAGWTVKFVAAGGTCADTALAAGVTVAAGAQEQIAACVTPPASADEATIKVYFQARSTGPASNGLTVSDTVTDAVIVELASTFETTLTPNNTGQVTAGGSVTFPHILENTGTENCIGGYTLSAVAPSGWSAPAFYLDTNGNGEIDPTDTLVTGPITTDLDAGETQPILVRVFGPGAATAGAEGTYTVVATFAETQCGAPEATDTATIVTGQVRVVKSQSLDINCDGVADSAYAATTLTARPGQCVSYNVVATNEGAAPVTNVTINDAVPAYTELSTAQPPVQCQVSPVAALTGTAAAYAATASAVSCGSSTNTLAPGGKLILNFGVKIAE